jgi:hypothetical protein
MPLAFHIAGYIEIGVKPGSVLISLITNSPSSVRKKSARTRPSQDAASKASTASRWTSAVSSGVSGAGTMPGVESMYLASKS